MWLAAARATYDRDTMAAPKFAPAGPRESQYYSSPDVVPDQWSPERPGVVEGLQPVGPRMGAQGPDQGFALTIAARRSANVKLQARERLDDAVRGCLGIALRRASLFSRAPVVHDVDIAFTIWGYYDATPPAELVARRAELFEGVGNVNHHYAEARAIADLVPESTLRMTPDQVRAAYPSRWRELTGA
jgi:hypothetical protein